MLGEFLQLSTASVKRLLFELEHDTKNSLHSKVTIEQIDGSYFLQNKSNYQNDHIVVYLTLYYLKESLSFNLLLTLINSSFASIDEAMNEMAVSYSYYYKIIKILPPLLNKWGLLIGFNKNPKKSNFIGQTWNKRAFLFVFFWGSYHDIEWPFKNSTKKEIKTYSDQIEQQTNITLSHSEKIRLNYIIAIFFESAVCHEEYIELDPSLKEVLAPFQSINDISSFIPLELKKSNPNLPDVISESEQLFFNLISRIFLSALDTDEEKIVIGKKLEQIDSPVTNYSTSLLKEIILHFNLTTSTSKNHFLLYYINLYTLSVSFLTMDQWAFIREHPTKSKEHLQNIAGPKLTEKIKKFYQNFSKNWPNKEFSKTIQPDSRYLESIIYFTISYLDHHQLTVYVHYSKGFQVETWIKKRLHDFFSQDTLLITNDIDAADVIISDTHEFINDTEVFYIMNVYTITTWNNLNAFIQSKLTNLIFELEH